MPNSKNSRTSDKEQEPQTLSLEEKRKSTTKIRVATVSRLKELGLYGQTHLIIAPVPMQTASRYRTKSRQKPETPPAEPKDPRK